MAKSLKSKRARQNRQFKRIRYGAKERLKLDMMVKAAEDKEANEADTTSAIQFVDVSFSKGSAVDDSTDKMEVDVKKRSARTLLDENGTYPVWMNQRKIALHKKKLARKIKKKRVGKKK
ncbi:Uncharacterized protein HDE_11050 [Halotydeus destructor]|nr:Uncharacterized protein HDE_11050 [Halotydeus destructor]